MLPQAKLIAIIKHQIKHLNAVLAELEESPPTIATPVDESNAEDVMRFAMSDPQFIAYLQSKKASAER